MPLKKLVFWSHLVFGVVGGLFIFVKAATGVILAFEPQISEWSEQTVQHVNIPENGPKPDLDVLLAKAREAKPQFAVTAVTIKSDPAAALSVAFGRDGGSVFLNPFTGDILGGNSKTYRFLHKVEEIHRWFGFRPVGKHISGVTTLAFSLLAFSGIYLWWPRKTVRLKNNLSGKARDWNWHNVFGFWLLPVFLMMSVTGVIMSYQWANNLLFRVTGNKPPAPPQAVGREGDKESLKQFVLEKVEPHFLVAAQKLPNWSSLTLRLPQKPGAPVVALIEEPVQWGPYARSQLTMDAATADVKKWEPYSEANAGRKARMWARYLHTGEVFKWPGQFLVLLGSLGTLILVWTGFAMSWHRFKLAKISK